MNLMNMDDISAAKKSNNSNMNSSSYSTITEYLEKLLFPTLSQSINKVIIPLKNKLIYHIQDTEDNNIFEEEVKNFNRSFFENKALIIQKQKELIKLERGTDYSESDFENFIRMNLDIHNNNESRNQDDPKEDKLNLIKDDKNNILEEEEGGGEYDFDDDDSEMMDIEGEVGEEENKEKFNAVLFVAQKLKELNLNKPTNIINLDNEDKNSFLD